MIRVEENEGKWKELEEWNLGTLGIFFFLLFYVSAEQKRVETDFFCCK